MNREKNFKQIFNNNTFDKKRYLDKGINKIGFVDIETGGQGFNANTSFMVTWAIYIYDLKKNTLKTYSDKINKKDIEFWDRKMKKNKNLRLFKPYDVKLVQGLIKKMRTCNMIIGHYSDYFDIPFVRTRAMILRIPFLKHTEKIRFGDSWKRARFGMKFIRNGLDVISRSLGIDVTKTHFDIWVWNQAAFHGKSWAINEILSHNIKDVKITYKVWKIVEHNFNIPSKYS